MNPMNTLPRSEASPRLPTEAKIRERAYQFFEESGRVPGHDWDHWLRAEAEMMAAAAPQVPRKWHWHYRALQRIRAELSREREEQAAMLRAPLAREGADMGDVASDQSEHATMLAEISREDLELAEVEAALARIEAGTYGICEATGIPIDAERLRAVPWTRVNVRKS